MSEKPEVMMLVEICRGLPDGDHVHINITKLPPGCAEALAAVLHRCCVESTVAFFGPGTATRFEAITPVDKSKLQ